MSSTLLNQCDPRLIQVDESCGCAVTRASITAMKPSDFEANFWKEMGMEQIVAREKELRMTGVPQHSLVDILMSRMMPIKQINMGQQQLGQSVIAPFIMLPQESVVNANYFELESAGAAAGAGVGDVAADALDMVVKNQQTSFTLNGNSVETFGSDLPSIENYFLPGRYVAVVCKLADNTARVFQFKVITSVNADAGGVYKATVTANPTSDISAYTITSGVVIPLANSVSDYESWCYQDPSENTRKLRAFWVQTIRETHCYNSEYLKALNAPLTTDFFKKFRQLPLAEQKRKQGMHARKAFYNTVFWGQAIDANQTVETYTSLPQVKDPADATCLIEYKANTIGIREQLNECGKVIDFQGAALDLDVIKAALYGLRRHRSANGTTIERIEAFTDRWTAGNILTLMSDYYQKKYGMSWQKYFSVGEKLKFNDQVLWNYDVYQFREEGVDLVVIHDPYFDDHLASFPLAHQSAGRYFMMVDWSDINVGIAGARSVNRKTNEADDIYNCVIQPNVNYYQLMSKKLSVIVGDPNRHLIYTNFSGDCPELTATTCTATSYS